MRKTILAVMAAVALTAGTLASPTDAFAQRRGGAVAAGVIGGIAAGAILGGAIANSRPAYAEPPRAYYEEPRRVYVEEPRRRCYWGRGEPVWDDYRGVWRRQRVQVCD